MEIRKMKFEGKEYNVFTDEELEKYVNEMFFKKKLEEDHEKYVNGELEPMTMDDIKSRLEKKRGL